MRIFEYIIKQAAGNVYFFGRRKLRVFCPISGLLSGFSEELSHFGYYVLSADKYRRFLGTTLLPNVDNSLKVKVKESRIRPGVAQRFPGGLGSQIFKTLSTYEGGEVVSLTHRPSLPPGMFVVLIFTRVCVEPRAMVRSEGICH